MASRRERVGAGRGLASWLVWRGGWRGGHAFVTVDVLTAVGRRDLLEGVKTDLQRPAVGYRNDAVFQSAQRLIASRPAKQKRPLGWGVLAGVALGMFAAGFAVRGFWASRDGAKVSDPVQAVSAGQEITAAPTKAKRPAVAQATAPGDDVKPTRAAAKGVAGAVTSDSGADGGATPAGTAGAGLVARDAARASFAGPAGKETVHTTVSVIEIALRGRLDEESATSVAVPLEFYLRVNGRVVSGYVRFLDADGERAEAHWAAGEIDGRKVRLRDRGMAWARQATGPGPNPTGWVVGREFVFDLPEKSGTEPILGVWSLGTRRGTLTMAPSLPW